MTSVTPTREQSNIQRLVNARITLGAMSNFAPVRTERAHEAVARMLRASILEGQFTSGDRLPVERTLVETFQVSRSAIRQALLSLEQQGLVTIRAGSGGGAFVRDSGVQPVLRAFENLLALQSVTTQEYFQAKSILEPAISAAAAENISAEHLDLLAANITEGEGLLRDGGEMFSNSAQFHLIVARATGNPVLELMLEVLIRIGLAITEFGSSEDGRWNSVLDDHRAIVTALRSGSREEVHRLMREHLCSLSELFPSTKDQRSE